MVHHSGSLSSFFGLILATNCNTGAAHISTRIEGPQRNCVLTRSAYGQIERIAFPRAVGDAIVGKDPVPGAAIHTDFSSLYSAGDIIRIEHRAHSFAADLWVYCGANNGRRSVDLYRLADAFSR